MRTFFRLMAVSTGTLASVASMTHCQSTCEERGDCETFSGTGGSDATGGKGATGGSAGNTGGTGATGGAGTGGKATGGVAGDGGDGGESGGGSGGEGGMGPDPCDGENPVAGCVISDPDGIYVAPSGDDTDNGTKGAPLETLSEAISQAAGTNRTIYVCNGTFEENLEVNDDGIVIRGGYVCPSASTTGWLYEAGTRARVRPLDTGYALRVTGADNVAFSDLDFASRNATQPGESSVAVFVTTSDSVSFERTRIVAGDGMAGANGVRAGSNHTAMSLDGNAARGRGGRTAEGLRMSRQVNVDGCSGRRGRNHADTRRLGQPNHGGRRLRGEAQTLTEACTNGGIGAPAPADDGRIRSTSVRSHKRSESAGFRRREQTTPNGRPGKAVVVVVGARRSGKVAAAAAPAAVAAAKARQAARVAALASALLALDSVVTLDALSAIETGSAGSGGSGDAGEGWPGRRNSGPPDGNGCLGGIGGKGAAGGSGGGGAGGVAVGILSKGGMITSDEVTFTPGTAGAAGQGGGPPTATPGAPSPSRRAPRRPPNGRAGR